MPKSAKQCELQREQMKEKIIQQAMLYFAKNGFSGTKISDLSKMIGIAQGTIYLYFASKEALFEEIKKRVSSLEDVAQLKRLVKVPMSAKRKITMLSETLLKRLVNEKDFAAMIALNTQMMLEMSEQHSAQETTYYSEAYQLTMKLIIQGQRESSVVEGNPEKLADYYWGVIYLYALKLLFTNQFEMIDTDDLNRTLLVG